MRALILFCLLTVFASAQDAELTNHKCGISLVWGVGDGSDKGTAYAEEYWFHDKLLSDRKTVYIKDDTLITMSHNAENRARTSTSFYVRIGANGLDNTPATGDEGIIRYKVDRDYQFKWLWHNDGSANVLPAYSAPFAFEDLEYEPGVPVVGTTGDNGIAFTIANKATRYYRGMVDSVGDEWHTITVADDDSGFVTFPEWKASDGKVFYFVVNPKTPCLTVRATVDGQFYTTPPKAYFIPVIHDQTTYFNAGTGTVTFELRDINGNNVFYRINGGSFTDAGANNVTLDQDDFSSGTNTLEYYYAGNAAYTKTRTVVKNPSFPSAGETHGNIFWEDAAGWTVIQSRALRAPYLQRISYDSTNNDGYTAWRTPNGMEQGMVGRRVVSEYAADNAIYAKLFGLSAKRSTTAVRTYAQIAKEMLMDNHGSIDPVGKENGFPDVEVPSREVIYRGYYDVKNVISSAVAYDTLLGIYKSTDAAGGITAIEDYFIRDSMARWAREEIFANLSASNFNTVENSRGGMWDSARKVGALAIAIAMPAYSSPVFGTSGVDGVSTANGTWNPQPTGAAATWKELYITDAIANTGYPNLTFRGLGMEDWNFNDDGNFVDRLNYFELMRRPFGMSANMLPMYFPGTPIPDTRAALVNAAEGDIIGLGSDSSPPQFYSFITAVNERFPDSSALSHSTMLARADTDPQGRKKSLEAERVYGLIWYDDTYFGDTPPPSPPADPTSVTASATSLSSIRVTWTDAAINEDYYEIRRGLNGTDWDAAEQLPAGTTSYDATGLLSNTLYYFEVRAGSATDGVSGWVGASETTDTPEVLVQPRKVKKGAVRLLQ